MDAKQLRGDEALLEGLLQGLTLAEAARAGNVAERTARRRAADPAFRMRLDGARAELDAVRALQLAADSDLGRRVLRSIAENEDAKDSDRIAAARYLMGAAYAYGVTRDFESRVEMLERLAGVDPVSGQWRNAA